MLFPLHRLAEPLAQFDELRPQVAALIDELGLSGPQAIGKLMPQLMERFKGRAEGRVLSQLARELLSRS